MPPRKTSLGLPRRLLPQRVAAATTPTVILCLSSSCLSTTTSASPVALQQQWRWQTTHTTPLEATVAGEAPPVQSARTVVLQLVEQLQAIALPPLSSGDDGRDDGEKEKEDVPRWQRCLHFVLSASPSLPTNDAAAYGDQRLTEEPENSIALLESLSTGNERLPVTDGAPRPSTWCSPRELQCVMGWLLHACLTSDAPLPLAAAVYQTCRMTLRQQQPQGHPTGMEEEEAEAHENTGALAVKIPWVTKRLHASYARFLLHKYQRAAAAAAAGAGAGELVANVEVLALFDSFFHTLLIDSAEDTVVEVGKGDTREGKRKGKGRKELGRGLTSSVALQLLLLEGLHEFLSLYRRANSPRGASNGLRGDRDGGDPALDPSSFPTLAWLLAREGGQGAAVYTRVREVARACLAKLEPTDFAPQGLLLSWAVFLELYFMEARAGRDAVAQEVEVEEESFIALQKDSLLRLASSPIPATGDAVVDAARDEAAREASDPAEATLLLMGKLFRHVSERVKRKGSGRTAATGTSPRPPLSQPPTAAVPLFLDVFPQFLSFLASGESNARVGIGHYTSRALLQRCRPPKGATGDSAGPWLSPVHWFLVSAVDAVEQCRQDGGQPQGKDWQVATVRCVDMCRKLFLSLDQALAFFSKRRSSASLTTEAHLHRVAQHNKQMRALNHSMQVCWLCLLNAVNDGAFLCPNAPTLAEMMPRHGGEAGNDDDDAEARKGGNGSCAALTQVVLPLYHPRYWRRESLNAFVAALDAWGLSEQLRLVHAATQKREAALQERVWRDIRSVQGDSPVVVSEEEEEQGKPARGSRERVPLLYSPALTLQSCDIILRHTLERLRDPRAAAAVVKYMLIAIRAAKMARDVQQSVPGGLPPTQQEESYDGGEDGEGATDEVEGWAAAAAAAEAGEAKWFHRIKTEYIPAVDALFVEQGIDRSGAWMSE